MTFQPNPRDPLGHERSCDTPVRAQAQTIRTLVRTFLIVVTSASVYEGAKQLVFPSITLWQSHAITIAVFGISATIATYYQRRSRSRLIEQVSTEFGARRRTEATSARTEERYRLLFERNQAGVFHTGLDGTILDCNDAAARLLAFDSAQQILAVSARDLHPSSADRALFLARLTADKHVTGFQMQLRRKDGRCVWVNMNASLIEDPTGGPAFIEGTFVDITAHQVAEDEARRAVHAAEAANRELEESREHLQLALDGANEALWDWNIKENRTYYSLRWAEMLGYSPDEVGDSVEIWERLLHPEDKITVTRILDAHLAGLSDTYEAEFRMQAKQGGWRWIQARGRIVSRAPDGSALRVAGTHVDITEHKQLHDALASARDASLAASRAKSSFLASMSHEIRTPMNAILGYSQLMLRDPTVGVKARANLQIINRSGEHLLDLIDDILVMSKIEAGRVELNPVTFDVSALVQDVDGMFRLRAEAKRLQFSVSMTSEGERCLSADLGKMRQVLVNLTGNALKFTEHGGITVVIAVNHRDDGRLWLSARVEDTGVGIAPADQALLFQPFAQGRSGAAAPSGTGLGLAISAEFARLMGGTITMSSQLGRGSLFLLEVPVQAGVHCTASAPTPDRRVVGLRPGTQAPRVLVVDDEEHNRGWLTDLLTLVGFHTREAESGEGAIKQWQEWQPHLILMDVRMPGLDGLEATRIIRSRSNGQGPVIIALTASALGEDRHACLTRGMDDFLTKPCREGELLRKIQKYLKQDYVFADEDGPNEPEPAVPAAALTAEMMSDLPVELIDYLLESVLAGDKDRLDLLIQEVEHWNTQTARTLKVLADNFDYDALTPLFRRHAPAVA